MTSDAAVAGVENADRATIDGFGEEWAAFDQTAMESAEWQHHFDGYFSLFPWDRLPADSEGFDLGCGSGRWAAGVAPRVGRLHCIDPSDKALAVAQRRLASATNVDFACAGVSAIPLADNSQDFGYSLGVLHHIPDTAAALASCVAKLKPGAPFLVYLYYAFDNRPLWFRTIWRASDIARRGISRMPFGLRKRVAEGIAATVYLPLSALANLAERAGADVSAFPLSSYRHYSFYTMRTDALDRFGTRLEQRFTRAQIGAMMSDAGLEDVRFRDGVPYWVACGRKRSA